MTEPQPTPVRSRMPLTILVPILGLVVAIWFLRTALAPFFLAMVLAYLLEPLASRLSRWMPRDLAAFVSILMFMAVVGLLVWAFVPVMADQVERLYSSMPNLWEKAVNRWMPWLNAHPPILNRLRQVLDSLDPGPLLQGLRMAGMGLVGWVLELMTLLLVPLIVYYLLVEGANLSRGIQDLIPARYQVQAATLAKEIHDRLGGYIRGQLAVVLVMALLQGLGFQLLGVPYAWLLGLLAGISNVVPYSTYVIPLPLALAFSALNGASGSRLLVLILVFVGIQISEAFYFTPVWIGKATGLHPLEVLLAIFCFGFVFGFVGLIFAVPLMIIASALSRPLIARYKSHPWFNG